MDLRSQFNISSFGFDNAHAGEFFMPLNDHLHTNSLIIIRGVFATYMLISMSVHITMETLKEKSGRWFLYFTSWNYIIVTAYFVMSFIQTLRYHYYNGNNNNAMSNVHPRWRKMINQSEVAMNETERLPEILSVENKILWCLYDVTITTCPLVAIIFWFAVDFKDEKVGLLGNLDKYFTVDRHGISLCFVLIEFFFQQNPYRILHFYIPCLFMLIYISTMLAYWFNTGVTVYRSLDYSDSKLSKAGRYAALFVKTMFLVLVVFSYHLIFYFVDVLKKAYITS